MKDYAEVFFKLALFALIIGLLNWIRSDERTVANLIFSFLIILLVLSTPLTLFTYTSGLAFKFRWRVIVVTCLALLACAVAGSITYLFAEEFAKSYPRYHWGDKNNTHQMPLRGYEFMGGLVLILSLIHI